MTKLIREIVKSVLKIEADEIIEFADLETDENRKIVTFLEQLLEEAKEIYNQQLREDKEE